MKVSVIIPTYNRADFIGQAIESVIAQTYTDWELLVMDDASNDDTERIVADFIQKDPRISYTRQKKNIGISRNRNAGIEKSAGTYVAMLDSDDVWIDKEKLAKQVVFLEQNTDHALVGTQVKTIDTQGNPVGMMRVATENEGIRNHMLLRNQFIQSSVLFVKKTALHAGLYDPGLVVNEDYDLWLKMGTTSKFANISDITTGYRIHAGSIIRSKKLLAARVHFDIIKKYSRNYPRFAAAAIKSYLRILRAYFF